MPPRWVSAAILVGWIAASVWLFRQEIWPSLEPGSPPPFTIDLVDEAQQTQKQPSRWSVSQDGVVVLTARTTVEHRVQENDFTLRADYDPRDPGKGKLKMPLDMTLRIKHMNSSYRVTPEGRLLSIEVEIEAVATLPLLKVEVPFEPHIWGNVRDGTFAPFLDLKLPGKNAQALPPVAVSSQGSVVMPLHPINRIAGLKPGHAWRVPMFDPVGDSLAALDGSDTQVRFLRAKVRPQTEIFERDRTRTPCLVIDYQEEKALQEVRFTAETWVSEADGRVLKQVSNLSGNRWVMERENQGRQQEFFMIQLDHVTKLYGSKTAVRDLTLDIAPGELFAFLGPNGAGKTTTIKMMVGLLFPTSGTVRIGGFDLVTEGDKARQLLSYVPDQPFLYEKLTGREFLQFIADMYGLTPTYAAERIAAVIDLFSLHEFVDDLTERYSHGMRQRTVFASALVHEPKVLIVDEPTVGLDPRSVRELKDLLRKQADQGTTVFLSSHSLDVVEELADRIAIVDHGRLISCDTLPALRTLSAVVGSLEDVFLKLTEDAAAEIRNPKSEIRNPKQIQNPKSETNAK